MPICKHLMNLKLPLKGTKDWLISLPLHCYYEANIMSFINGFVTVFILEAIVLQL